MAITITGSGDTRYGLYIEPTSLLYTIFDYPLYPGASVSVANKQVYRLPATTNIGSTTTALEVSGNPLKSLNNISATSLLSFTGAALTSLVDFSGFALPQTITTVTMPNCTILNGFIDVYAQKLYKIGSLNLSNSAIDQTNVDAQLASFVSLVNDPGYTGAPGTINLSGGTIATPSTQGLADAATLTSAGFTVLLNLPAVLTLNSFNQTGCSGSNQLVTANATISGYSNVNIQLYMTMSSSWMDGSMWSVPNFSTGNNNISLPFNGGAGNFTKARLKDYTTNVTSNELTITLTNCP